MRHNPYIHQRRSIRLPSYDYRAAGAYFVTICTRRGACIFHSAPMRRIVELQWQSVGRYSKHAAVDEFVIMPNHVHGIIWISNADRVGAQHTGNRGSGLRSEERSGHLCLPVAACAAPLPHGVIPGSLAAIVRAFKSASAKRINALCGTYGAPVWQRNYYERVIRNDRELTAVRRYIRDNPAKWADDPNHPQNI